MSKPHSDVTMFSLKVSALLLLANSIFAGPLNGKEADPAEGMKKFFVDFADGKPDIGLKPMDPMIVKNVNFPEESLDINSHFPELKVTGLKEANVLKFSKTAKDIGTIELKYNMVAEGPVSVQFPKKNKELKGDIKYEAVIDGVISYRYSEEDGKVIGEEFLSCEASNAKYTITDDFKQVLEKDPDASAAETSYNKLHDEHVKKVACKISKAVFTEVVENIKALAASGL